jgi:hypothetical protein
VPLLAIGASLENKEIATAPITRYQRPASCRQRSLLERRGLIRKRGTTHLDERESQQVSELERLVALGRDTRASASSREADQDPSSVRAQFSSGRQEYLKVLWVPGRIDNDCPKLLLG